jgi:excisionase family DNA binding protein
MDEILTPLQVAKLLKIHVKTVYRLVREGAITGKRIGRSWRFSREHIMGLVLQPATPPLQVGEISDEREKRTSRGTAALNKSA